MAINVKISVTDHFTWAFYEIRHWDVMRKEQSPQYNQKRVKLTQWNEKRAKTTQYNEKKGKNDPINEKKGKNDPINEKKGKMTQ